MLLPPPSISMRRAARFSLGCALVLIGLLIPTTGFILGQGCALAGLTNRRQLARSDVSRNHDREGFRSRSSLDMSSGLEKSPTAEEYELLRGVRVKRASDGEDIELLDAWKARPGKKTIVAFFTHTADFNSWEYAQKLRHYLPQIDDAGIEVVGISLGTVDAARDFCAETGFPLDNLFMDATGDAYTALGFSNGFQPRVPGDKKVNPYLRLLPMLAGIGSPGTLQAVLKGYVGDPEANADWISSAMNMVDNKEFDILGKRGSRPLELATLRLQNMRQIVTKWNKLSPPDKELITQQGGTVVFEGREKIYSYKDKGILVYTDVLDMLEKIGVKL